MVAMAGKPSGTGKQAKQAFMARQDLAQLNKGAKEGESAGGDAQVNVSIQDQLRQISDHLGIGKKG